MTDKTQTHRIAYLIKSLDRSGWSIVEWLPSDGFRIAGRVAVRWQNGAEAVLALTSFDLINGQSRPLDQAFAVDVEGAPHLSAYLIRQVKAQERVIDELVSALTNEAMTSSKRGA